MGKHQTPWNALTVFIYAHQAKHCLTRALFVLFSHGIEGQFNTFFKDSLPDLSIVKQRPILVKNDSLEFLNLLCHVVVSYGTNRI